MRNLMRHGSVTDVRTIADAKVLAARQAGRQRAKPKEAKDATQAAFASAAGVAPPASASVASAAARIMGVAASGTASGTASGGASWPPLVPRQASIEEGDIEDDEDEEEEDPWAKMVAEEEAATRAAVGGADHGDNVNVNGNDDDDEEEDEEDEEEEDPWAKMEAEACLDGVSAGVDIDDGEEEKEESDHTGAVEGQAAVPGEAAPASSGLSGVPGAGGAPSLLGGHRMSAYLKFATGQAATGSGSDIDDDADGRAAGSPTADGDADGDASGPDGAVTAAAPTRSSSGTSLLGGHRMSAYLKFAMRQAGSGGDEDEDENNDDDDVDDDDDVAEFVRSDDEGAFYVAPSAQTVLARAAAPAMTAPEAAAGPEGAGPVATEETPASEGAVAMPSAPSALLHACSSDRASASTPATAGGCTGAPALDSAATAAALVADTPAADTAGGRSTAGSGGSAANDNSVGRGASESSAGGREARAVTRAVTRARAESSPAQMSEQAAGRGLLGMLRSRTPPGRRSSVETGSALIKVRFKHTHPLGSTGRCGSPVQAAACKCRGHPKSFSYLATINSRYEQARGQPTFSCRCSQNARRPTLRYPFACWVCYLAFRLGRRSRWRGLWRPSGHRPKRTLPRTAAAVVVAAESAAVVMMVAAAARCAAEARAAQSPLQPAAAAPTKRTGGRCSAPRPALVPRGPTLPSHRRRAPRRTEQQQQQQQQQQQKKKEEEEHHRRRARRARLT